MAAESAGTVSFEAATCRGVTASEAPATAAADGAAVAAAAAAAGAAATAAEGAAAAGLAASATTLQVLEEWKRLGNRCVIESGIRYHASVRCFHRPDRIQLFPQLSSSSRSSPALPAALQLFPQLSSSSRSSPALPAALQLFPQLSILPAAFHLDIIINKEIWNVED